MRSLPNLPPDLIKEILSWLPVKLLVRFTCVCKYWKSVIFDPTFAKLHLQRSPKHTHTLLTLLDDSETLVVTPYSVRSLLEHPSFTVNEDECCRFKDESYQAIGSINGLVGLFGDKSLEDGSREICIILWNPTLRLKSKNSPSLCLSVMTPTLHPPVHLGFGYDHSTDTYKVVAVFWDLTMQKMEGRVHCMGDSCWRKTLACPDFPILLGVSLVGSFTNNSVNWLAIDNLNGHEYEWKNVTMEQLVIFSLDLRKETCKYMLLPAGLGEKPIDEPAIAVLRGCLCLYYDPTRTHFVMWEMREFGVQESWTKLVNISYVNLQLDDLVSKWFLLPTSLSENGDVLLLASKESGDNIIMYNPRDGRVELIELPNNKIWYADEHMQTLVLPCPHPH